MNTTSQELKSKVSADFEPAKKAFQDSMAKAQRQIDVATAEVNKLRAELKSQTDEAKVKTVARVTELTKNLDATRKQQQAEIEERLKQLHTSIQSINAELKHATAEGKVAAEAMAKAIREEYDSARRALARVWMQNWPNGRRGSTPLSMQPPRQQQPQKPPSRPKSRTYTPSTRQRRRNCRR